MHTGRHDHCGAFCLRKKDLREKSSFENNKKFYRSKQTDGALYEILSEMVGDFTTQQRLDEVGHGMEGITV